MAESIAEPIRGRENSKASSCQEMSTSSGSVVEPEGLTTRLADTDVDLHASAPVFEAG
jgi:hypothetical protein